MVPPKSNYERLVAGGLAGAVSRTLVAPFERLRTLSMTDPSTPNMMETSKEIYRTRGIRGTFHSPILAQRLPNACNVRIIQLFHSFRGQSASYE